MNRISRFIWRNKDRVRMNISYTIARIKCFYCRKRGLVHNTSQGTLPCWNFLVDYGYCERKERGL